MNSPCDLLIKNCTILPMNSKNFIENGSIAVKNSKIAFVGKNPLEAEACKEIDGRGMVALPGLVNCHTHVPMTLFRGVADEKPLRDWLRKSIWPLEAKLKAEDVYLGALLGCLEMIKSGTTCFGDMYFFEDAVARAVEESGLRGVLAEGIIEAGNRELGEKMLSASVAFAERFNGKADGRITAMLGPHAAYSCSPELLCRVKEEAARLKVGVHIHVAESEALFRELQKHKASEVEFLDDIGFLDARVVAAHCINLSANDKRILSKRGVNMVYVPVANMKLG
ncbi:MAG: amidohydrolase family protein, partial [Candidatus Bathyarchaeia archaeon]